MRKLIESGYIYVAQPPLYRMKKGKQEWYVTDEKDYEKYILENGIGKNTLRIGSNGSKYSGARLIDLLEKLLRYNSHYRLALRRGIPGIFLDKIIENNAFCNCHFEDRDKAFPQVENSLGDMGLQVEEVGLMEESDNEHKRYMMKIQGTLDGNSVLFELSSDTLVSIDFHRLNQLSRSLKALREPPFFIVDSDREDIKLDSHEALIEYAFKEGRRGLTVQRYKGLGEMNPDQLWATTMDPEIRTLLRITLEDAVEAERIFTILMGDEVEPRRRFIEEHAFSVQNLDV